MYLYVVRITVASVVFYLLKQWVESQAIGKRCTEQGSEDDDCGVAKCHRAQDVLLPPTDG